METHMTYFWTTGATLLALAVYFWAAARVGAARARFGVPAPAISGQADFERVFRAQQNTMEQLILFLPVMWLLAMAYGDCYAGAAGVVWSLARVGYVLGYSREAAARRYGFVIGMLATVAAYIAVLTHWAQAAVG